MHKEGRILSEIQIKQRDMENLQRNCPYKEEFDRVERRLNQKSNHQREVK